MEQSVLDILRPDHVRRALRLWNAENAEPQLISAVENFVYSLERPGLPLILRLTPCVGLPYPLEGRPSRHP